MSLWLVLHDDCEEFVVADIQTVLQALVNIFGFLRNHTNTLTCVASSCMVFACNNVPVRLSRGEAVRQRAFLLRKL